MKEPYREGVAIHSGPKSCVGVRKGHDEALTGVRTGWALLPKHFHLLVRTAQRPLARSMRSLLTGYAGTFNRRHRRSGHLFQNRYKSIVCEDEPYFLELIRYLHLNPLRVRVVRDLRGLGRYRYSGHATLLGRYDHAWQDTQMVLEQFAKRPRQARAQYERFVADGVIALLVSSQLFTEYGTQTHCHS